MTRKLLLALLVSAAFARTAAAQCGSYPNTLTNGQPADASQVMANFNFVLNCLNSSLPQPPLQGYLSGLALANNVGSPNTTLDIAAGVATSDDAMTTMKITAFTKNANAAWAVGSGNGALDSGATLAASTWYHVFLIARADTNVVDVLLSTSAVSPTLPMNYTKKRRIGSVRTNASAQMLPFFQNGDWFLWKTSFLDQNAASIGTTATAYTTSVPSGFRVQGRYIVSVGSSADGWRLWFYSPDMNNEVPSASLGVNGQSAGSAKPTMVDIWTNTSAQIRGVGETTGITFWLRTLGWMDYRGRFD